MPAKKAGEPLRELLLAFALCKDEGDDSREWDQAMETVCDFSDGIEVRTLLAELDVLVDWRGFDKDDPEDRAQVIRLAFDAFVATGHVIDFE